MACIKVKDYQTCSGCNRINKYLYISKFLNFFMTGKIEQKALCKVGKGLIFYSIVTVKKVDK